MRAVVSTIQQLAAAVFICPRTAQDQGSQDCSMEGQGSLVGPPLLKELGLLMTAEKEELLSLWSYSIHI